MAPVEYIKILISFRLQIWTDATRTSAMDTFRLGSAGTRCENGNTTTTRLQMTCHRTYVKILKFGTPQTIAIIVLKIEKFDVTLH